MEGLASLRASLENIRHEAGVLAEKAASLVESLAYEAERLRREDAAERLRLLHVAIIQNSQWFTLAEDAARTEHVKRRLRSSFAGLAAEVVVALTTNNRELAKSAGFAFDRDAGGERSFGTVMIYIGPEGLPNGTGVVSISDLARETRQAECRIIDKLRNGGYLLFTQEAFSSLIGKLTMGIREGWLDLPISSHQIARVSV